MADPAGGLTLDAGALLAVERRSMGVGALLDRAQRRGVPIAVPAGVVAQVWRGGPRQALVAGVLFGGGADIVPLDRAAALEVGIRCGESGHSDIVDVHVAVHAADRGHAVVTSDPDDLSAIAPDLPLIVV